MIFYVRRKTKQEENIIEVEVFENEKNELQIRSYVYIKNLYNLVAPLDPSMNAKAIYFVTYVNDIRSAFYDEFSGKHINEDIYINWFRDTIKGKIKDLKFDSLLKLVED